LKDQLFAVAAEVGFRVLAAEGQLAHVAQMLLGGKRHPITVAGWCGLLHCLPGERKTGDQNYTGQ
jgi:hypothetical protein